MVVAILVCVLFNKDWISLRSKVRDEQYEQLGSDFVQSMHAFATVSPLLVATFRLGLAVGTYQLFPRTKIAVFAKAYDEEKRSSSTCRTGDSRA